MRVALDRKWIDRLLKLPESGMGYQCVDVHFSNRRVARNVTVFNAEQAELPAELASLSIRDIKPHRR